MPPVYALLDLVGYLSRYVPPRHQLARDVVLVSIVIKVVIFMAERMKHLVQKDREEEIERMGNLTRFISLTSTQAIRNVETNSYDVIIVGGGTAGSVLASRLSNDPKTKVLLLEAGQTAQLHPFAEMPLLRSPIDDEFLYNIHTEAQPYASNKKYCWPVGKMLGGCSNITSGIFHHGSPSDYDEWAKLQKGAPGASEWLYSKFAPCLLKPEKFHPNPEYPYINQARRGRDGPIDTGYYGYFSGLSSLFMYACEAVGIQRRQDANTRAGTLGVTRMMSNINSNGRRVTVERTYLNWETLLRENLTVVTNASVRRIICHKSSKMEGFYALGVEFRSLTGQHYAAAPGEIILCAGAVHTPKLLMLSGIGPADHLSSLGIRLVADIPGVGSNLKDQLMVDLLYKDRLWISRQWRNGRSLWDRVQLCFDRCEFSGSGRGPLTSITTEAAAFVRSDDPAVFPADRYSQDGIPEDSTSGKHAPDLELYLSGVTSATRVPETLDLPRHYFSLHATLLRPKSSGTVRLRSKDPGEDPIVNPGYLTDRNDVKTLMRGVRLLNELAHTAPLGYAIDPIGKVFSDLHHELSDTTDEELEVLIRQRVQSMYHPACSARMAPLEDGGVVNPSLYVHGAKNLRIVDASVLPTMVSGHPLAAVIAVAEKAAGLIEARIHRY